jgi:hypothetical protein
MTGAEILRGVAALFEQPGTWTQYAWARDAVVACPRRPSPIVGRERNFSDMDNE